MRAKATSLGTTAVKKALVTESVINKACAALRRTRFMLNPNPATGYRQSLPDIGPGDRCANMQVPDQCVNLLPAFIERNRVHGGTRARPGDFPQ